METLYHLKCAFYLCLGSAFLFILIDLISKYKKKNKKSNKNYKSFGDE